ncbi:DUF874 family protein [Helicobacter pylori]|uniref:DUF874 family protein n=1 Tax=Helicobacter pylori Shi169 TaxID=1163741 RepID=A0A0E0W9K2_HELPX|nr:DUF874 family protein [Helicobacter pylori]AFH98824.1 hypothetical protein HPSH169_00570 [Helicobacter pylori Shi169]QQW61202.1 DUF874 family protein [Helicobacter pylori]
MPIIRVLVMLATMMMKLVKTTKEKKVFKNVGMSVMGIAFWEAIKDSIKKQIKKSNWICGNVRTADDYLKTHPNSWFNSVIGVTTITTMLMNVCFADDQSKKEVAEAQKEAESARDRANKSGIELEQEKQKTIKAQKDFIKDLEQNCKENHGQFFIEKGGIKGSITIEVEAECKTPKPTKTNQTPIQPKHLPNSKQPHSQRGSKAQELIAYLQKELESLPYSQKAIAKQVNFYRPSSIAYLELDPRDFNVTEEWQNENLKIRSKAQAKMLEMRNPQANLSPFQSFSIIQNIVADINKEIEAAANTEKKAEKVGYGYSKRM